MQQLPWWVYLVPVLATLAGGASALVGVFAGPWVKARTDLDQWRRERRLDSYAELARTTQDLAEVLNRLRRAWLASGDELGSARQGLERAVYELERTGSRVHLLGAPSVRNASAVLLDYVEGTIGPFEGRVLDEQWFDMATDGLAVKYVAFLEAARHDLGVG
jgi:hypothetical protein